MRAALLPTPGEPFMLAYWLRNFETWRDEVDELFVLVNGGDDEAREMVKAAGGRVATLPRPIGHGPALRWLLENTKADEVVLCEDDAYVRIPTMIGSTFWQIDRDIWDVIGSPRYEDNVSSAIEDRWPKKPDGTMADLNRALWPAFLFARTADLLATDRNFGDTVHRLGETIPGLGIKVTPEICAHVGVSSDYIHIDTFYATTYQLRRKRIEFVHRVRTLEAKAVEDWIKYDPPWFHVSGLSAIWIVLAGQTTNLPDWGLWPRRVAWWERTYRTAPGYLRDSAYGRRYRERLDTFRAATELSVSEIQAWDIRLEPWVTWERVPA